MIWAVNVMEAIFTSLVGPPVIDC